MGGTSNNVDIEITGLGAGLPPLLSASFAKFPSEDGIKAGPSSMRLLTYYIFEQHGLPVMHWKISLERNAAAHNMTTRKMAVVLSKKRMKTRVKPLSSSLQMVSNNMKPCRLSPRLLHHFRPL